MQEFIGAVGVGLGAQHAADHELGLGEALLQNAHERDGAALADVAAGRAVVLLRGGIQRLGQPGRGGRGVPAGGGAFVGLEDHLGVVGRVGLQQRLDFLRGGHGIHQRRQAQRQLESGARTQHVAGAGQRRQAFRAGHGQGRTPGAVQQSLFGFGRHGQHEAAVGAAAPGETAPDLIAQDARGRVHLFNTFRGDFAMQALRQQAAGAAVFEAVQQMAQDAERRRHHAAGVARVHALVQHLYFQRARHHAAQRGRHPELVVVAGARIQAHHQGHVAQAVAQRVHVGQQVVAAGFLTGFDDAHTARPRNALLVQRHDGGQRGVHGVAVVRAATAVQLAVFQLGGPGAQAGAPAGEFGLLVQVAVQQHGVAVVAAGGGRVKENDGRAARQAHHFQLQARDLLRFDPLRGVAHHALDEGILLPVRVKSRALGRDGDVVGQRRDDLVVPFFVHERLQGLGVQGGRKSVFGDACVHGAGSCVRRGIGNPLFYACAARLTSFVPDCYRQWKRVPPPARASGPKTMPPTADALGALFPLAAGRVRASRYRAAIKVAIRRPARPVRRCGPRRAPRRRSRGRSAA